jgi:NADH-quinone oxidoreductase subunit G
VVIIQNFYLFPKAIDNDFSGNMIDVCPVGATDKTFRFKSRVWFNKPFNAHRENATPGCCGETTVWMFGDEIQRVTQGKTHMSRIYL